MHLAFMENQLKYCPRYSLPERATLQFQVHTDHRVFLQFVFFVDMKFVKSLLLHFVIQIALVAVDT